MKKVPCSYKDCGIRRSHFTLPDEPRGTQMVSVSDEYDGGEVFCSFTCAIMAGKMSVRQDPKEKPKDRKSTRLNSSHSQQSRMPSSA